MTSPLRLLYSFPHLLDRPGIAYTALNQILGLSNLGLEIELFCAAIGSARLPANVRVHETLTFAGKRVPHRSIGVQRAYNLHDFRVAQWLQRHDREVDLAHVWPQGSIRTLRAGRKLGLAMLRESPNPHTASVMRESAKAIEHAGVSLPANHSHAFSPQRLRLEEAEYEEATAVLVPSDYARQEFLAEGFPADRLLQHRYGCDLQRFKRRTVDRDPHEPLKAVFIGRGDPTKGLHVALKAWEIANLAGASFTIAGRLQSDYAGTLEHDLQFPGVQPVGFVQDVPELMRQADVMLLPTWTEGSALVTIEAQASGCVPLISTAAGPLGESGIDYLEHAVGDARTLAEQLQELAGDPERLASLSRRGTERRNFLSWDTAAVALAECYHQALEL